VEVTEPTGPVPPAIPQAVESATRAPAAHKVPQAEPTAYTRQLVASLADPQLAAGALTPQASAQWKQTLQALMQQGAEAVPAIREFLESNRDLNFGSASEVGYPSTRTALLEALQQIAGPEAQALMLETLQITAVPGEIARLAKLLEQQAPGQFRTEINTAAGEILAQAAGGQFRGLDMGPLFDVIQQYADASTVALLEKSVSGWSYYSVLALANLPSGDGIPSLIRLAEDRSSSPARAIAIEALAQVAAQSTDATATLVRLAGSGALSAQDWIAVARMLGGDRYFIKDTGLGSVPAPGTAGVRTFHLESSNQNYYSMPAAGGMSQEQIDHRVAIIDQLLVFNPGAAAAQSLQRTRAALQATGPQSLGVVSY
jgi:HEAT repeat protein